MSEEKKPVAVVRANFNPQTAKSAVKTKTINKTENKTTAKKTVSKKKSAAGTAADTEPVIAMTQENDIKKEVEEVEEKAMAAAEEKKTAKKTTTRKTAAKKSTASAEKKTAAPKKAAVKTPEAEVILQWNGNDYSYARLLQSAKDVWQYDLGKNVVDFKSAQIYVKPEEGKAYVVVNGTDELSFDI